MDVPFVHSWRQPDCILVGKRCHLSISRSIISSKVTSHNLNINMNLGFNIGMYRGFFVQNVTTTNTILKRLNSNLGLHVSVYM